MSELVAESDELNTPVFSDISEASSPVGANQLDSDQCEAGKTVAVIESEKRKPEMEPVKHGQKRFRLKDDPFQGANRINNVLSFVSRLVEKEAKEKAETIRVKDEALSELARFQLGVEKTANDWRVHAMSHDVARKELVAELNSAKAMCSVLRSEKANLEDQLIKCQSKLHELMSKLKNSDTETVHEASHSVTLEDSENESLNFLESSLIKNGLNKPK